MLQRQNLIKAAIDFLNLFYSENETLISFDVRLAQIESEIFRTGTYFHTFQELEFGAKVAWRNSNRCIGRLYWKSLQVVDRRYLKSEQDIEKALINHIKESTNDGAIQPMITVFRQQLPNEKYGLRIHNTQLLSYAGKTDDINNKIIGDSKNLEFTNFLRKNNWTETINDFSILPIAFQFENKPLHLFEIPKRAILEVPIIHPEYRWFSELNLKWYALPAISNMVLKIGGINYTAAPFSGWYMGTEIGARDLADVNRYNQIPIIAKKMGLNTNEKHNLWKDKALITLNEAVLYSFDKMNVRITDHHTASEHYMIFEKQEAEAGRKATADWSWIVPPVSGAITPVFHKEMSNEIQLPNFFAQANLWKKTNSKSKLKSIAKCPFH